MKPLIEVCVGRHCCYDKEIPWHQWVASPALGYHPPGHTLTGRGVVPSGQPLVLWVKLLEGTIIIHHYWLNPSYIPVLFSLKFPFVLVKFT